MGWFRAFFPRRKQAQNLPLLSLRYSSADCPYSDQPDETTVMLMRGAGVIRTRQDAIRCLRDYPGRPLPYIIKKEKRKRRFQNRIMRALRRLRRRF